MKRVLLGMSGGTDSSVAAILLKEQGYEVVGTTLRLWSETDNFNNSELPQYILDAKCLAEKLNIEHHIVDAKSEFYTKVIEYFKNEYLTGRTPNPCAKCNVVLKWKLLLEQADRLECDYISTGHYTQIEFFNGNYYIKKGNDPDKEQSFFLWGLNQEILSRIIFPLGKYNKAEVKNIAAKHGFEYIANKKESTGVCFLNGGDYQPFLQNLINEANIFIPQGNYIDTDGNVIGKHNGYPFYTVGQRRGLGLNTNSPLYVSHIAPDSNTITLCNRNNLYKNEMLVTGYNLVNNNDLQNEVITKIRYRKQAAPSIVSIIDSNTLKVNFIEPEWSIAPGQTAAFYIGERLIGGGYIDV